MEFAKLYKGHGHSMNCNFLAIFQVLLFSVYIFPQASRGTGEAQYLDVSLGKYSIGNSMKVYINLCPDYGDDFYLVWAKTLYLRGSYLSRKTPAQVAQGGVWITELHSPDFSWTDGEVDKIYLEEGECAVCKVTYSAKKVIGLKGHQLRLDKSKSDTSVYNQTFWALGLDDDPTEGLVNRGYTWLGYNQAVPDLDVFFTDNQLCYKDLYGRYRQSAYPGIDKFLGNKKTPGSLLWFQKFTEENECADESFGSAEGDEISLPGSERCISLNPASTFGYQKACLSADAPDKIQLLSNEELYGDSSFSLPDTSRILALSLMPGTNRLFAFTLKSNIYEINSDQGVAQVRLVQRDAILRDHSRDDRGKAVMAISEDGVFIIHYAPWSRQRRYNDNERRREYFYTHTHWIYIYSINNDRLPAFESAIPGSFTGGVLSDDLLSPNSHEWEMPFTQNPENGDRTRYKDIAIVNSGDAGTGSGAGPGLNASDEELKTLDVSFESSEESEGKDISERPAAFERAIIVQPDLTIERALQVLPASEDKTPVVWQQAKPLQSDSSAGIVELSLTSLLYTVLAAIGSM